MKTDKLSAGHNAILSTLPRKVSAPLVDLLDRDHLSPSALETILDASLLTDQRNMLLGFAVAYHHLRMQGVEVQDVVRMAKRRGRRINLGWSPSRWQSEHQILSRAETLDRLAQENIQFDVAEFAALLPEKFPGYLIRSSRRLGMEGLRQRHCVAGYANIISAGYSALAVVFVDKQRWTVQLGRNQDPEDPLRISQIKGRFNCAAHSKVLKRVHEILGVSYRQWQSSDFDPVNVEGRAERIDRNLAAVLPVLRACGIEQVIVRFDGYGDSGNVDGAVCRYPDDEPYANKPLPDTPLVPIAKYQSQYRNGQFVGERDIAEVTLTQAFESIVDDYLETAGVDWYNNEGGFGEFNLYVETGRCEMVVERRIQESEIAFTDEKFIETDHQDVA